MLKNKTIICISPIDWNFLWQRHQLFMTLLAKQGNRILFVENLNPSPRQEWQLVIKFLRRMTKIIVGNVRPKISTQNIIVITPFLLPLKNKGAVFLNKKLFIRLLADKLINTGGQQPVVWTYLATSATLELIKILKPAALIYDNVFDALEHPDSPPDIRESEETLIRRAHLVLTDDHYLFMRSARLNHNVHLIAPGVDYALFSSQTSSAQTDFLDSIPRPRVCFFGGVSDVQTDFRLVEYVAKSRPAWNIMFFGTIAKSDVSFLRLPNVHLLKAVPHAEVPSYLNKMDAIFLPYKMITFTKSIFPAKTFECLATGKPVVGTAIDELISLNGLIRTAATYDDFVKTIETALAEDSPDLKKKRQDYARANVWEERFKQLEAILNTTFREVS